MPYPAAATANTFLDIAKTSGQPLDPMKLQKLVYFSHGWHLAFQKIALSDDPAEAWSYGPVFPALYHGVKQWGSGTVREPVRHDMTIPRLAENDAFAKGLVNRVWEVYGPMSGVALSQLTHEPGGPWKVTREKYPGVRGPVISNAIIQEYFEQKVTANSADSQ